MPIEIVAAHFDPCDRADHLVDVVAQTRAQRMSKRKSRSNDARGISRYEQFGFVYRFRFDVPVHLVLAAPNSFSRVEILSAKFPLGCFVLLHVETSSASRAMDDVSRDGDRDVIPRFTGRVAAVILPCA